MKSITDIGEWRARQKAKADASKAAVEAATNAAYLAMRRHRLPPIRDGLYRVLASDGELHDIPKENLEKAFAIDPQLRVLNP
jgi:hypothetical protein